ncbi:MAG TPA: BamA/TamA family outer membrane protein [Polyangiaceae bacterium]
MQLVRFAWAPLLASSAVLFPALTSRAQTPPAAAAAPTVSAAPAPSADPASAEPVATEQAPERARIRYTLQGIEVRGNTRTRDRVVLRYVPFRPGDILDVSDPEVDLTRYRLLGTGFFSSVQLSLRKGDRRGEVVLVIEVVERNTLVVNDLWMGLAGERTNQVGPPNGVFAYGGLDIAETNLAGTGITLGAAIGVGSDQLALRTRFFDPAFLGTGWMTSASLLYNDARDVFGNHNVLYEGLSPTDPVPYAVVKYTRFGGNIGAGHDLSVATQLWFDVRLEKIRAELPRAASHVRGLDREPISFNVIGGDSVLSTIRATLLHDTRDEPILPTRGSFVSITGDTAIVPAVGDYGFSKLEIRASRWWTLPWNHVVRLELDYGAITGNAPFFEKFYVGDFTDLLPDRVLGLNFDRRRAPNFLRTDIVEVRYGDYAAKLQGEYRIPIYRGHRSVYGIDLFGAAGIYGVASHRDLTDPPRGYGGLRRVPIDLTFNLGFRIDTSAGGFLFAFSNLVGLFPVRGEAGP